MEVNRLAELQRKRKAAAATNNFKRDTGDAEVELPHVDSPVRRKRGGSDEKDRDAAEEYVRPERKERGDKKDKPSSNLAAAMKPYEEIKEGLQLIRKNVQSIDSLKEQDKTVVSEKQRKDIMTQLDKIMSESQKIASSIKSTLDQIKTENDAFNAKPENKGSATAQMRTNMYMTHVRRFHQEMNAFNQASHDFKNALKDRTRRQLVIIDKNLTQDEVETIVESGHAEEVIKGMITADLDNVVRDIEERHQGIMKLEKQVLEIYELFRDLATLIDLQQETLDVVEHRIANAKDYTNKGMEALKSGEKYQKKANKRQRIILACVLCIMVALVLLLSLGLGAKFF